jgi:hypothetical protein
MKDVSIPLEQLCQQAFEGLIIDRRIWIEKIKINVDEALLGGFWMRRDKTL